MAKRGNNEGSIYQRKDERWTAAVTVQGGKRKYLYGSTRDSVRQQLLKAQGNQAQGLPVTDARAFVRDYLSRWLEAAVKPSVRPRSFAAAQLNVNRLLPRLGGLRLSALSATEIQAAYGALLDRGLSRRSVEQAHSVLHRALKQAVGWGLLVRNPTDSVTVPRPDRREMRTLTEEQVQALFAKTVRDRWHALWVVLVTAGLRLGEATGLRWDDVKLDAGTLSVQRSLQWQKGAGLVFVEPKTKRSRRTVHLAPGAVAALREHRRLQAAERLAFDGEWGHPTLVFPNAVGRPVDPARITDQLGRSLKAAEVPRVRVHDLRHTCATLLLQRNVHPKLVQEMLGHSTIAITLDLYSHVIPAMHGEVAMQMEALFAPVRPEQHVI
jgi:integrase